MEPFCRHGIHNGRARQFNMNHAGMLTPQVKYINWAGVPDAFVGRCSAVCLSLKDGEVLVAWFGHPDFAPFQPVMLLVPGAMPISIEGHGYAPAAELRDCAVVTWGRTEEKLRKFGTTLFDIDDARERAGLLPRDQVDTAVREAMASRVAKHKASPVTDPSRQPVYPNQTGRQNFVQVDNSSWKDSSDE